VIRTLDRALQVWGCILLLALFATVLAGVVTRAMGAPLIWTDEGARFLMVWLACCGWMLAGRRRSHVRIRYFQGLLPPTLHRTVEVVIQLACALLGVAVAGFATGLIRRNMGLEATSLPIAMGWMYVPLIPAGLLLAAQSLAQAFERRGVPASASPVAEVGIE